MRHRPTVSRVLLETLLVGPIKGCLRTVQRGGATDWRKGLAQRATNRQQSASNRARTPETYKQGVPESSVLELTRPEQGTREFTGKLQGVSKTPLPTSRMIPFPFGAPAFLTLLCYEPGSTSVFVAPARA